MAAGHLGDIRRVFEAATRLPRSQQNEVADSVEVFVAQHANGTRRH